MKQIIYDNWGLITPIRQYTFQKISDQCRFEAIKHIHDKSTAVSDKLIHNHQPSLAEPTRRSMH